MPAVGAATRWYVRRGERVLGPFEDIEVALHAKLGHLLGSDQLWCSGLPGWVAARDVPGLLATRAELAPPAPYPAPSPYPVRSAYPEPASHPAPAAYSALASYPAPPPAPVPRLSHYPPVLPAFAAEAPLPVPDPVPWRPATRSRLA